MSIPILTTKLYIPPQRPNLVYRPRLVMLLDEALQQQCHLILVSAKAGSGKTTLVSEWVQQGERPSAWISLDDVDNDPLRFSSYLVAALQGLGIEISPAVLNQVQSQQPPVVEDFAVALINDMAASAKSAVLVLDDYHLIQNSWVHQLVGFLAEYLAPDMQLIILTRVDPPLPLARLRGRGQVMEIRGGELRFTAEEAAQFLNDVMGLELPPQAIAALEERTEGWIVGLQMAALSMQGRQKPDDLMAFIDAFRGTNRYILDYLMEEVLSQQTVAVQNFLLDTSILQRMCGLLCDDLLLDRSGSDDRDESGNEQKSQFILEYLERTNLFVVSLDNDRRWYRYHHLFADLLASTLKERRSAAEIREIHRPAGRWHQGQGHLEEAMIHTMAAQDYDHAAAMIDENIVSMLARSEAPVLLGWIEKLPEEMAQNLPWVDIYRAYTLALSGRGNEAEPMLDEIEQRIDPDAPRAGELLGHIAAIRAFAASLRGDLPRVVEMAALAEKHLPQDHLAARGMAAYALTDTFFAVDDMENASQASERMVAVGEQLERLLMIVAGLCDLATTRKVQGRLHQAEALYKRSYEWMVKRDGLDSRVRCPYEIGMADLLREWNQLDAAQEHAAMGIAYGQRFTVPSLLIAGHVALMRVYQAQGDMAGALVTMHQAEQFLQNHLIRLSTSIEFNSARINYWLAVGDVRAANRLAERMNGRSEVEQITRARLQLAQGDSDAAWQLLEEQRPLAEQGGRTGRLIEILSLQALALQAEGKFKEAGTALSQAVSLARPEGFVRLFLDLGRPLFELLQRMVSEPVTTQSTLDAPLVGLYERELLDAIKLELQTKKSLLEDSPFAPGKGPLASPVDPLTERELDVLKLLAEGFSNKEMADKLIVAPSTVKQHLKNIYSKLDVHSRVQAVKRGQELGLI